MLDKKYNALEKEDKWLNYWKENKVYEFKPNKKEVYSIDTPGQCLFSVFLPWRS